MKWAICTQTLSYEPGAKFGKIKDESGLTCAHEAGSSIVIVIIIIIAVEVVIKLAKKGSSKLQAKPQQQCQRSQTQLADIKRLYKPKVRGWALALD